MSDCSHNPNYVSFDPGWNDPPVLQYNAQQMTPKPRTFLNKRVAFPLSGSTNSPSQLLPINVPPLPASHVSLPPVHTNPRVIQTHENISVDSDAILQEVKGILTRILDESSELGPKLNDIKRRIGLMEQMWTSGQLNSKIQIHMKDLAGALNDNEPSKADELHRALMVDHVSAVGTWMPGIKQLIHHYIARSELLAIDHETDND